MNIFNVIFYILLCSTEILALTSIDELIFPISSPTKFILDWIENHPYLKIKHDIERVRKFTSSDKNERLTVRNIYESIYFMLMKKAYYINLITSNFLFLYYCVNCIVELYSRNRIESTR